MNLLLAANEKYNSGDFVTAIEKYNEIIIKEIIPQKCILTWEMHIIS